MCTEYAAHTCHIQPDIHMYSALKQGVRVVVQSHRMYHKRAECSVTKCFKRKVFDVD